MHEKYHWSEVGIEKSKPQDKCLTSLESLMMLNSGLCGEILHTRLIFFNAT